MYEFGQFTPEHLPKVKDGVELFNKQEYWECHEALEHVWLEDRGDNARDVYWAIIQVAAAMIHYRQKNLIGAQGMIKKAKEKFNRARAQNTITKIVEKYLDWNELESLTLAIDDKAPLEDFSKLYNFRFKNYQENANE